MAVEIERKFLLADDGWKSGIVETQLPEDGLVARFGEGKVRLRQAGDRAWLTIKGPRTGIEFAEVELVHADQEIDLPPWSGAEITHDPRYRKHNLLERARAQKPE